MYIYIYTYIYTYLVILTVMRELAPIEIGWNR